jgi:hypothetical protein
MSPSLIKATFSQEQVCAIACEILDAGPDPIPAQRLLKEVLRLPGEATRLRSIQEKIEQSKWIRQLERAQLPDGSWGRFHSQDSKTKTIFRTTEEAIDRAFALGLGPDHAALARARAYIENVLAGKVHITDWEEKGEAWPLLIKFILAGRLAALQGRWPQIDPANRSLDADWEYLAEVAEQAFSSGEYRLADETKAYLRLSGIHVPKGFIESQHALWILSARPLPTRLEHDLLDWIWNKPDGIRYLRVPLSDPQPRTIAYWIRSMNILTRFASWRQTGTETLNRLWEQRDAHGLWDFGRQTAWCADFPLSESWRRRLNRKVDYTTCILAVLRRWFD